MSPIEKITIKPASVQSGTGTPATPQAVTRTVEMSVNHMTEATTKQILAKTNINVNEVNQDVLMNIIQSVSKFINESGTMLEKYQQLLALMFDAYNKNNKSVAKFNAKMSTVNQELAQDVAADIRRGAIFKLASTVSTSFITAGFQFLGQKRATDAAGMSQQAIDATQLGSNSTDPVKMQAQQTKADQFRKESMMLQATSQKYNMLGGVVGNLGQSLSLGDSDAQATQALHQDYLQSADKLFQIGVTDSESMKKFSEEFLSVLLSIKDQVKQSLDTIAANCKG